MAQAEAALKTVYGYEHFREGQRDAVQALVKGNDVLAIMPTGAGKSLCYQIPAIISNGITLVISPLISLMKDQVNALLQLDVRAAYINSTLTNKQQLTALGNARKGLYKIIYIAPERLNTEGFLDFALNANISNVIIDEAHCVSQWGQDFRPAYLNIAPFIAGLKKRPVVGAFTATATLAVQKDIIKLLDLHNPLKILTGFDRPNLFFEVLRPSDRDAALLDFVMKHAGQSGIVYCVTRRAVEDTAEMLKSNGIDCARYHAGLSDDERTQAQEDFINDRVPVIVATNAFGMGIDKSNVSFVVHYQMPKDLESYYQEAGRAGRDGEPADCCLLYMPQDIPLANYLIEHSLDNAALDIETARNVREQADERLRQMVYYCTGRGCLRNRILSYFGEVTTETYCGNCSACLSRKGEQDVTREAGQIVSLVMALNGRYGRTMVASILCGKQNERIISAGLNQHSAFGALASMGEGNIYAIIDELLASDVLSQTAGDYPCLVAGHYAKDVLSGDWLVRIPLDRGGRQVAIPKHKEEESEALFRILSKLRLAIAREQRVPPFVIFSNATLKDMAKRKPRNRSEMLRVNGVGENKMRRYGETFLTTISFYVKKKGTEA
ncbi:MAG: DNA helicase RecQ [Clostridia bacterium]|nr:DNA helicase RecQ [Clostridia bacterium]